MLHWTFCGWPGERIGLAKARLLGVEKATAPVLLFLDSHCEVASQIKRYESLN